MKLKNLRINKKGIVALLTAGTIAITTAGCATIDTSEITYNDILENSIVQEITSIDDEVKSNDHIQGTLDDIEKLETAIEVSILNKNEDFSEVDQLIPLSDEEKEEALNLNIDEIKELKEISKNNDTDLLSIENRLIAIKKLAYIDSYYKSFMNNNGLPVSKKALRLAIKGSISSETGVPIEDISIGSVPNPEVSNYIEVTVGEDEYKVKSSNNDMWNAIDYIIAIDRCNPNDMEEKDIRDTCIKALNYAKTVTLKGTNIHDDKIEEQYSNSYVNKKILK